MHFESRYHRLIPVANAAAAVRLIESGQAAQCDCPTWTNANGHRIALVNDAHLDDRNFSETAVVNLDTKEQYDTITFGWIETEAEKLAYVQSCEDGHFILKRNVTLPCSDADRDTPATFTCSCCDNGFTSTLRVQQPFDQDTGYGFCPKCLDRISRRRKAA